MKRILNTFVWLLILWGCGGTSVKEESDNVLPKEQYGPIKQAGWLLGSWTDSSEFGKATEIWRKQNDSTLAAESFIVAGKDTVFYESVQLQQRMGQTDYIVSVKDQNGAAPVPFTLTLSDSSRLIFENPQHDFPSRITYTKITNDSLYAEISGVKNGKERKEGFPFKRVKASGSAK